MDNDYIIQVRQLSQLYAYTSIRMHETVAKSAGFSATDHKYLGFFLQKGALTAGELAELTGLTTGAVTGLIDRFEKKKLVRRQFDKKDRRRVIITANTEKVTALLEPLYKDFQQRSEELIASFPEEEVRVIESYFRKAIALMDETRTKLGK